MEREREIESVRGGKKANIEGNKIMETGLDVVSFSIFFSTGA